ncbi:DNase I-like protein, partial [Suillus brevipes Sb2]
MDRNPDDKKTRANIKIASLNIKGRASPELGPSAISKWAAINRMMRDNKIGILCVQETHLCPEHLTQIENLYSRRLKVLNSSDTNRPGNSAGIAFIMNKEIIDTSDAQIKIIVPGRAATLSVKWHNNKTITILNIYAPNNANDHKSFWERISDNWTNSNVNTLDFMMGDFNLTEDPIDRAPARRDNEEAIDALRELRTTLKVQDLWRITHPNRRCFTFSSNHQTLSRLDRIYPSEEHTHSLLDWESTICQVPTDHQMVSVRFAPPGVPHIGKGRWTWPTSLIADDVLINKIIEVGMKTQRTLETQPNRTEEANPQTIWLSFKTNMNQIAKDVAKTHLHKINQRIRSLTKDLRKLANTAEINVSENMRLNEILIEKEISHLQKKSFKKSSLRAQAKWATHGETISKYWSRINCQKSP